MVWLVLRETSCDLENRYTNIILRKHSIIFSYNESSIINKIREKSDYSRFLLETLLKNYYILVPN